MAQQLTGIFVVGHTDGYAALRHTTLEGIEILAMWGIKLVETDERLAGRYLQEILVLVVGGRIVGIVTSEALGQEIFQKFGLEDTATTHEHEHQLVHHLLAAPAIYHAHKPFAEGILEVLLGVIVFGRLLHRDAFAELVDVVGIAFLPFWQSHEIILDGVELFREIRLDGAFQSFLVGAQSVHIHQRIDGILHGLGHLRPFVVEFALGIVGPDFHHAGHGVQMHLISGVQPLHQHLHAWAGSVFLALRIEMPAAPTFRMIEHPVHDAFHTVILASIFRRHPVEQFFLPGTIVEAEGGKSHAELVMAARFKSAEPAL